VSAIGSYFRRNYVIAPAEVAAATSCSSGSDSPSPLLQVLQARTSPSRNWNWYWHCLQLELNGVAMGFGDPELLLFKLIRTKNVFILKIKIYIFKY